ncbi:MAG: ligase [Bacteroidaceae bacterium]|nr:ligase [Bacteroidaceae bacterium]
MEREGLTKKIGDGLFTLLILLFLADPTNTIFHLKNIVFLLFLLFNIAFYKADYARARYFLYAVSAVSVSFIVANLRGTIIDLAELKGIYTAFAPLLLLPWIERYDVVRLSRIPVLVTAGIVVSLFWIIFFFPVTEAVIYPFMWSHDNTIMMSHRYFLGMRFFGMYCKSTVAMLPVFCIAVYNVAIPGKRTFVDILLVLLLLHLFLISGTRSTTLLPLLLFVAILFVFCRNRRYFNYFFYPAAFIAVLAIAVILFKLLMEKSEASNLVKYAHITSYLELFERNPLFLLFGQGPATYFYSEGFRHMTNITEWTYLELLRCYGIFSAVILYVIIKPLVLMFKYINTQEVVIAFILGYMLYLVIAGTNPLFLSSTGMLVVLSAYSFLDRIERNNE